jgi:hypothetical protein
MKTWATIGFALVLVAGLVLASPASAGDWGRGLHRPLDLHELQPGDSCPVSPVDQSVDWESINIFGGFGTGPGPVYPGIGGGDSPGHVFFTREPSDDGPWVGTKVFWYVKPDYRGPALIRGRRLDGPGRLRFHDRSNDLRPELRIKRRESVQWSGQPPGSRGHPSGVYGRSRGCYGVQMDGTWFSRTVVFTASIE